MNKKLHIQEEVEKTLRAFEESESIKADPYFYTRLEARIDEETRERSNPKSWFSEFIKPALLAGIVAANIVTSIIILRPSDTDTTRDDRLQTFAEAYSLDSQTSVVFED